MQPVVDIFSIDDGFQCTIGIGDGDFKTTLDGNCSLEDCLKRAAKVLKRTSSSR